MSEPAAGNELAEVLWENGVALRRRTPTFFPPFACSAARTARAAQEVAKCGPASSVMRDLLALQDDDAVPWLHCPIVDDVTAPLPLEYCSGMLSDLAAPAARASRGAGGAPSTSRGGVAVQPSPAELAVPKQPARPSGEGVMNFTFFSRPLQRPPGGERATTSSNPVESTVVQQTATNRLRSTPLFSEQRMAWLKPPKESRTTVAAPPPPPPAPPAPFRQGEMSASLAQMLQPEARPPQPLPPPPTATTSSVCSDNGDRSQLKKSSHHHHHQPAEWSGSQDEDLDDDDDPSALRRSAGRSTKRGRTAEVHNMSERRRRDRINEKMRALQELIPNCNKIDKASMLEEAIEYLKTLQLQVQMMSMGPPGLCMPPMRHLQMPSPMAHFHHLGAMGALAAAGFGMGASAFDPRVAAAQFSYPMMPPGAPMFGMPVPSFSPHMANFVINSNAGDAVQDELAPSDHQQAPAVPRPM